jgi:hypothetical protein
MRIDRRGNPAFRKFPDAEELKGNVDLTGNAGLGEPAMGAAEDRPCTPSDAFGVLDNKDGGFLSGIANIFAAVGQALKDIKQGNSKTFD